ncbi:MAG TPA: AarF/UbiB family protein [Myxococcota bacterium]|nr:AarF/UbiB family protein [Myxococcota bacterium]
MTQLAPQALTRFPAYRAARLLGVMGPALFRYLSLFESDLAGWERAHARTAGGFAGLGSDLGGLYVKLCQVAGARADVFPPVFVRELARFHDRVSPRPFGELRPALERDLGAPLDRVFARFDATPLAAASLAQVHRAQLHDGADVAVKIQYPDAARLFGTDLANVRRGARLAARLFPRFPLRSAIEEVADFIALELDFAREAESLARVADALKDDLDVRVPRLYGDLCRPRLLVMEYLDGVPVHDLARLRAAGTDLGALADRLARLYRRMIFEHGFFHGDPHPGNLLLLRDGRIGLLDFGLAKSLPPGFGAELARMFGAALSQDGDLALRHARALGFQLDGVAPAEFLRALGIALGAKHDLLEVRELIFSGLGDGVPRDVALVVRTLILLNGLSERLAPGERRIARELFAGAIAAIR